MEERQKHLMVAIEHLHAAGMHDLAQEVERRTHGDHRRRDYHGDDRGHREESRDNRGGEVDQLRHEVEELRHMMREMRDIIRRQHEERNRR